MKECIEITHLTRSDEGDRQLKLKTAVTALWGNLLLWQYEYHSE